MGQSKSKHNAHLRAQPSAPSTRRLRPSDGPRHIPGPPSTPRNRVIANFKLPPELLLPIFDSALEELPNGTPRARFALNVSHVSRTWRVMAVGHTALWTTIVVDQQQSGLRKLIRLFLSRARSYLLDVIIRADGPENDVSSSLALKTVIGASKRWRSLTFRSTEVGLKLHRFVEKVRGLPFPHLQALHFAGVWKTRSSMYWSVLAWGVDELPALRTLRFSAVSISFSDAGGIGVGSLGPATQIMLRNLTALEFDASTTSSIFNAPRLRDIIKEAPMLTRLLLGGFVPHLGALVPSEPVLLPCLQLLQVPLPVAQAAQIFLEFVAPALEVLELRPVTRQGWTGFTSYIVGSGQTFPVLRALHLGNMPYTSRGIAPTAAPYTGVDAAIPVITALGFNEADDSHRPAAPAYIGFYAATPAIAIFSLDDVGDPAVLNGLVAASARGGGWVWPQMQEMRLGGTDSTAQLHGHLVVALVRARCKAGCPLRTLSMQDTWVDAIDPVWLRRLPDTVDLRLFTRQDPAALGDADW